MQLDRYKTHDIEIVVDRIIVDAADRYRISQSVATALLHGKGIMMLLDAKGEVHHFSKFLMDPETGLAYDEPAPNTFSFNSPYGACPVCNGLGEIEKITEESVIPDRSLTISMGGIAPLGEFRDIWIFKKVDAILKRHKLNLSTPIEKIPPDVIRVLLYGEETPVAVESKKYPGTDWNVKFEGIIRFLEKQKDTGSEKIQRWVKDFMDITVCPECKGARLKKESLHFKIDNTNIATLANLDINQLHAWFEGLEGRMNERQNLIAQEVLKEIRKRIGFLLDVALTTSVSTGRSGLYPEEKPKESGWPPKSVPSLWGCFTYWMNLA